ncbi:MAG: UDP-2-acetamido-2,6-dideoxy-beta-L-arabino-hexopyranos-4-ulose 3-epimerase [Betaproteobacteria bacterium]|nr:UDP-2-acetamido-2,6-dideoxy-beta-L-arabino-hexopyranos-4-ulose 3-epimerase [Betaproteobacteria bacterium]
MLGHRLYRHLRSTHDASVTLRQPLDAYAGQGLFDEANAYPAVDARSLDSIERAIADHRPQTVVNAVGIVKQRDDSNDAIAAIEVNSLLPHRLAMLCRRHEARLIHVSTDCVFSGRRGHYNEDDLPDASDVYGRSKLLGEVYEAPALTLRTSMIGRELARKSSLLEWFLAQRGPVRGFRNAIFSGFTTAELSRIIEMLIVGHPSAAGLYHVSSEPISKYDLLSLIRDKLGLQTVIEEDDTFHCDRSLDSTRFRQRFGYEPPSWDAMATELAHEVRA